MLSVGLWGVGAGNGAASIRATSVCASCLNRKNASCVVSYNCRFSGPRLMMWLRNFWYDNFWPIEQLVRLKICRFWGFLRFLKRCYTLDCVIRMRLENFPHRIWWPTTFGYEGWSNFAKWRFWRYLVGTLAKLFVKLGFLSTYASVDMCNQKRKEFL